ncbi:hypothetical protein [Qipengyuania oceanensis]|uniref:Uncharacterized protein n=1 Tax=Qipengyuania oceanensis TaxID=1463597 RepID=A0A844YH25_9SPHN|nr:hypothetical protein [Qipengyuania oceanensis]MXO63431.1 hypothetical protein [Qipengyuania oceanensis]
MGRWQTLFDTSVYFLEAFGKRAAREGWSTSDLFGLLPQKEHWGGLVDRLGDCRSLTLEGDCFNWESSFYGPRTYYRGTWPDLTAWWEINP